MTVASAKGALTILNPATVVYFAALVLGMKSGALHGVTESVTWVAAVFAASASWQLLLAAGGSALGRALSSERGRLVTAIVSAALILALALRTLLA